jgi:hypothetical protein
MEKRPQFVRMNALREETPPPRDIGCPQYRQCLWQAAFRNFCLDCSLCEIHAGAGQKAIGKAALSRVQAL